MKLPRGSHVLPRLAGAVLSALVLASCGAGGASSAATPTVASTQVAGGTGSSGPASGAGPTPGAFVGSACDLLTDADIGAVTGLGVATKNPKFMSGVSENGCDWTLNDASASEIQVALVEPDGRRFFDTYYAPFNSPLPGVGDAAIITETKAVMAVKGDVAVLVDYVEFPAAHPDYAARFLQAALSHVP